MKIGINKFINWVINNILTNVSSHSIDGLYLKVIWLIYVQSLIQK